VAPVGRHQGRDPGAHHHGPSRHAATGADAPGRPGDYSEIDVCIDCAEETWRGVNCPECHHEPTWNTIPYPLSIGSDAFDYQCQRCKAEFTVPFESTEPFMKALIEFSFHVFAAQLDDMTSYADDPMDVADLPISTTSQADGDYVWDQQIVD